MADIASLVKALKDKAIAQYDKGAPYRQALVSALRGDTQGINQALSKSDLTPMDFATTFAPMGITAWHGSPAKFEKFDLSKVGTGEGSQLYGHGLYFSENPKVAETYKTPSKGVEATAAEYLQKYGSPENAISSLQSVLDNSLTKLGKQHNQDAIDLIKSGKVTQGNVYKVDIADESLPKMLDFEKPLYRQSDEVKKLALDYMPALQNRLEMVGGTGPFGLSGSDLFNVMQRYNPQSSDITAGITNKQLTDLMLSKGITGTKYLDRSSANPEGFKNYVVFDPNTVKILERQ